MWGGGAHLTVDIVYDAQYKDCKVFSVAELQKVHYSFEEVWTKGNKRKQ